MPCGLTVATPLSCQCTLVTVALMSAREGCFRAAGGVSGGFYPLNDGLFILSLAQMFRFVLRRFNICILAAFEWLEGV